MSAEEDYRVAEKVIEEASSERDTSLDLSGLGELGSIPPGIGKLDWLEALYLNGTNISNLEPIQSLNLTTLEVSGTRVADVRTLSGMSTLERLNLAGTQVKDLSPLGAMPNLQWLDITGSPAELIATWKQPSGLKVIRNDGLPLPELSREDTLEQRLKSLEAREEELTLQVSSYERVVKTTEDYLVQFTSALENSRKELADYKEASDDRIAQVEKDYRESMAAAERAFSEDQAIKAPVTLWETKQKEHEATRDNGFRTFVLGLALVAGVCVILLVTMVKSPETVSALLGPVGCEANTPPTCDSFGLKGMIATAAVLTVLTVLLWFTRLQMKLYLAERHLVLDARERRAFAETYVGLLKEGDTSKEASEQRALVYSALFRPSSDGTIKDEGGIDPAVTAALSKLLSR